MYIAKTFKDYYITYQCILGKEHVQEMIYFLDHLPPRVEDSYICWNCVSKTDRHIKNNLKISRDIQLLRKKSDERKRATFLYRVQVKSARRDLLFNFSSSYRYSYEDLDSRPYYIQKKIDKMISRYQKNEIQAQKKRSVMDVLYSNLPKDIVDYIIKPYLTITDFMSL